MGRKRKVLFERQMRWDGAWLGTPDLENHPLQLTQVVYLARYGEMMPKDWPRGKSSLKRCWAPIRPHWDANLHSLRWLQPKKQAASADKDVEKLELSYFAHGMVKWGSHFGKQPASSSGRYHRVTMWPRGSTPRYTPKRNENIHPHKNLNIHGSIIHNNQKVEMSKCPSTNGWINSV